VSVEDSLAQLLEQILRELQRANAIKRESAVSSVKITMQRNTLDVAVHVYTGSDVHEAEREAIDSYRRVMLELNQTGVDAFGKTLKALQS
jgi:2-iminoacetate synthase ThiH